MKYIFDNDLHIHSRISPCANDPEQTPERILRYAQETGLTTICLTDHFWDEKVEGASNWYKIQNFAHISAAKPLPQAEGIKFLFGCEAELDKNLKVALTKETLDLLDFAIIPTTHFHMVGLTLTQEEASSVENKAKAWVKRLDAVLDMDLPFHKIGLAHLTCTLIAPNREEYLEVLKLLPQEEMQRLFSKAARLGVGIELNVSDMDFSDEEADIVLRPYRIAKQCGCKFYCGSDAHCQQEFKNVKKIFGRAIDLLELTEEDKFKVGI